MVDSTAPTPPSLDSAVSISPSEVKLNWLPSFDAVGVTAYKVYRAGVSIITLGTRPEYIDPGRAANTAYIYYVTALDAALNESQPSNSITVTTRLDPNAAATVTVPALAKDHGFCEIDFGTTPVADGTFIILDPDMSVSDRVTAQIAYTAPTNKDLDEVEMDNIILRAIAGDGRLTIYAYTADGSYIADKFAVNYSII